MRKRTGKSKFMTKSDKLHEARVDQFDQCYGDLHIAVDLVHKMSGCEGRPKAFDPAQVRELKRILRSAACHANALDSKYDGKDSPE